MERAYLQVFWASGGEFTEKLSQRRYHRITDELELSEVEIRSGEPIRAFRIDPTDRPGAIEIHLIEIVAAGGPAFSWKPFGSELPAGVKLVGLQEVRLPGKQYFIAAGNDPQLHIDLPAGCELEGKLLVRVGVRYLREWSFEQGLAEICAAAAGRAVAPGEAERALAAKEALISELRLKLSWQRKLVSLARRIANPVLLKSKLLGAKKKAQRPCSVIIPVYNSFSDALACLESVLAHSPEAHSIILIDDASSDGELSAAVKSRGLAGDPRLRIVRNGRNSGFVSSCNYGMRLAGRADPVLLNSDTIVTPGWLGKLREAVYSSPELGTATPLTNNGTICSVPNFGADNPLPLDLTPQGFAAIVEQASLRERPLLPTCVGFCAYIKREAIDLVGALDEQAFGLGYGEENDLSCRLQAAGFLDVLDDATFVYHKGGSSFGTRREELSRRGAAVLRERYPDYFPAVERFADRNPLAGVQARVREAGLARWLAGSKSSVLHVLQAGPRKERCGPIGGTELHVGDLIAGAPGYAHWSLVPFREHYFLEAHAPGLEREHPFDLAALDLVELIGSGAFDLIHIHHTLGFPEELVLAVEAHGRYIVSLHDMHMICPRLWFTKPDGSVCKGDECVSACRVPESEIVSLRGGARKLLAGARKVVHFSGASRGHYGNVLGDDLNWRQIAHGHPFGARARARPPARDGEAWRILALGAIGRHKGSEIVNEAVAMDRLPSGRPVEWHLLGRTFGELSPAVVRHGSYSREEVVGKIGAIAPHVVAVLSLCEESYCMTLDESWAAGIPVVTTPFGAPRERVERSGAGWILERLDATGLLELMARIESDPESYSRAASAAAAAPLRSRAEMAADYAALYAELGGPADEAGRARLLRWLERGRSEHAVPPFEAVRLEMLR